MDNSFKILKDLMERHSDLRNAWLRHILLLASTLFGVLISLHSTDLDSQWQHLFFVMAIGLLAVGILLIAAALYSSIDVLQRTRKVYAREAVNALRENRSPENVAVYDRKIFVLCEKAGYIVFAASLVLLVVYVAVGFA